MNGRVRVIVLVTILALDGVTSRRAMAQWGLNLEVQRAAFAGTSIDTSSVDPAGSFRPGGSPAVTIRVDRQFGSVSVGLGFRYAQAAVVLDGRGVFVGLHNELVWLEAAPEVRVRIVRTPRQVAIEAYGGPVIGVWSFNDATRSVTGAVVGLRGEFPVVSRLALSLRVGGGFTRSVFREGELPPEFTLRATRRSEIALGLQYGR